MERKDENSNSSIATNKTFELWLILIYFNDFYTINEFRVLLVLYKYVFVTQEWSVCEARERGTGLALVLSSGAELERLIAALETAYNGLTVNIFFFLYFLLKNYLLSRYNVSYN